MEIPPALRVLLSCLLLTGIVAGGWVLFFPATARETLAAAPELPDAPAPRHPVVIRAHGAAPGVDVGRVDARGNPVRVACGTCHATMTPDPTVNGASALATFHQGLRYAHGGLTCLSCHDATDYDSLRLADSRKLEFSAVMTLCSQCHGSQRRDYDQGLHGGMTGHWDLTRGGRERRACVHCHDPHAPAFPLVLPVLPPRDRVSVPPPPAGPSVPH